MSSGKKEKASIHEDREDQSIETVQSEHYARRGFDSVEFLRKVSDILALSDYYKVKSLPQVSPRDQDWAIRTALKYALRAGFKDGQPWEWDAYKCADFLYFARFGKFMMM